MGDLLRGAAATGDKHTVERLLAEGAKPLTDEGGRNALHLAAASGQTEIVKLLLKAKWDVNAQDRQGYTSLQRTAAAGHIQVVQLLIQHGANVNIQDKVHGNTALHEAAWRGLSQTVRALCSAPKVDMELKNLGGFAPLHLACQNGHNQSCRELLLAGANPDIQNNYGDTPLHTSARYGHAGVTRILISAECRVSEQNKNGDTALHITAAMGRRKLTRILLEAGCDSHRRNKQGERAKDIAIRKDLNEIIQIIETTPSRKSHKKTHEKKREKQESGSSKDSNSRPKDHKKHKLVDQVDGNQDAVWSPYGCHYYPDPKTFPKPKLDSLPHEPLKKGEQYYLDLAGNIRKGPVGVGYTCYCAPFFRHMEERLDRDKKELKDHIDAAQHRLDRKVTSLEAKTRGHLNEITRSMAVERAKCQQRHLHLEQWLLRDSKPVITRTRSLENILEERPLKERSVDASADNRCSSREGKESGKGSSELVGPVSDEEINERRLRRTTREISERIDEVLKNGDGPSVEKLCGDMLKWRSYHRGRNNEEEKQNSDGSKTSVRDIIAKFQKQQTVQELVARIQKETEKVHKSAQKWKESKIRNKENISQEEDQHSETSDEEHIQTIKRCPPDYENLTPWEENPLAHMPYRSRSTVYSPTLNIPTNPRVYESHREINRIPSSDSAPIRFSSDHNMTYYGGDGGAIGLGYSPAYSPTQNDSGYSCKPYGSTSTGPSPSLSVADFDPSHSRSKPPVPIRSRIIKSTTASLV